MTRASGIVQWKQTTMYEAKQWLGLGLFQRRWCPWPTTWQRTAVWKLSRAIHSSILFERLTKGLSTQDCIKSVTTNSLAFTSSGAVWNVHDDLLRRDGSIYMIQLIMKRAPLIFVSLQFTVQRHQLVRWKISMCWWLVFYPVDVNLNHKKRKREIRKLIRYWVKPYVCAVIELVMDWCQVSIQNICLSALQRSIPWEQYLVAAHQARVLRYSFLKFCQSKGMAWYVQCWRNKW